VRVRVRERGGEKGEGGGEGEGEEGEGGRESAGEGEGEGGSGVGWLGVAVGPAGRTHPDTGEEAPPGQQPSHGRGTRERRFSARRQGYDDNGYMWLKYVPTPCPSSRCLSQQVPF